MGYCEGETSAASGGGAHLPLSSGGLPLRDQHRTATAERASHPTLRRLLRARDGEGVRQRVLRMGSKRRKIVTHTQQIIETNPSSVALATHSIEAPQALRSGNKP